jgi:hypothetical protein
MEHWIGEGIRLLKSGRRQEAERALRIAVTENERSVEAWLWLSQAVDTDAERMTCLLRVMELDPRNTVARQQLNAIQQRERSKEGEYVSPFKAEEMPENPSKPASTPQDSLFLTDAEIELKVKSGPVIRPIDFGRILLILLIVVVVALIVIALFLLIR